MTERGDTKVDPILVRHLREHVEMLAGTLGPRCFGRPSALQATIAYIERHFAALGDEVERQNYPVGEDLATNLIVERRGTLEPEAIIVLGAHYDTISFTPGADDNGSAVAVLLEVARILSGQAHRRTIRFVAFACEEPPYFGTEFMGSTVYARRCRNRSEKIAGMLCLEMVGYYSNEPDSQVFPPEVPRWLRWFVPNRGNFLAAVGDLRSWRLCWQFRRGFKRASRFPLVSVCLPPSVYQISLSDNRSFWQEGYPALMLTDTAFLRNDNYHEWSDLPETLDYERMSHVAQGVAGAVAWLANARSFGSIFRRIEGYREMPE